MFKFLSRCLLLSSLCRKLTLDWLINYTLKILFLHAFLLWKIKKKMLVSVRHDQILFQINFDEWARVLKPNVMWNILRLGSGSTNEKQKDLPDSRVLMGMERCILTFSQTGILNTEYMTVGRVGFPFTLFIAKTWSIASLSL